MRRLLSVLTFWAALFVCLPINAQNPFPRLLPPAEDFSLTLTEADIETIPPGPSCSGDAGLALACRPVILTLQNRSTNTVHLSSSCKEPSIIIEKKQPWSSSGWWRVSWPSPEACRQLSWSNIRLAPGETTEVKTRLISTTRDAEALLPGSYTLRAYWTLFGCTEPPDGSDCLAPMQTPPTPPSVAYAVDFQQPITVTSNEILAESPSLRDLGEMKFSLEVTARSGPPDPKISSNHSCAAEENKTIECVVFHYAIGNAGIRPIRFGRTTCSFSAVAPQYRTAGAEWKPLPQSGWVCSANVFFETAILPGGTAEGEFTVPTLQPGYVTSAVPTTGKYDLRFLFLPHACIASPDGRFCIAKMQQQQPVASQPITMPQR